MSEILVFEQGLLPVFEEEWGMQHVAQLVLPIAGTLVVLDCVNTPCRRIDWKFEFWI